MSLHDFGWLVKLHRAYLKKVFCLRRELELYPEEETIQYGENLDITPIGLVEMSNLRILFLQAEQPR